MCMSVAFEISGALGRLPQFGRLAMNGAHAQNLKLGLLVARDLARCATFWFPLAMPTHRLGFPHQNCKKNVDTRMFTRPPKSGPFAFFFWFWIPLLKWTTDKKSGTLILTSLLEHSIY